PLNWNLATAQAAATPKTRFSGTETPAATSDSQMAGSVAGARIAARETGRRLANACAKTAGRGSTVNRPNASRANRVSPQRTSGGSRRMLRGFAAAVFCGSSNAAVAIALPRHHESARAPFERVDRQQQQEGSGEHHRRNRGGPGVIVLFELSDDQQRGDFGFHRHVAGDEDDRPILTQRACEGQREPGEQRRPHYGEDHQAEHLPAAGAQ